MLKKTLEILKWLAVGVTLLFVGCTAVPSPVRVAVDAYTDPVYPMEKIYYLEIPGDDKVEMELAARNFALEIDLMLYSQGYRKVFDRKLANYIIGFDYSVEGPFTEGTITQVPVRGSIGLGIGYGRWGGANSRFNSAYIGNDIFLADTVELREVYKKTLSLKAKYKNGSPAWEVRTVNSGSIPDIRTVFPYLVSAASLYVGRNSGEVVIVNVPRFSTAENYRE